MGTNLITKGLLLRFQENEWSRHVFLHGRNTQAHQRCARMDYHAQKPTGDRKNKRREDGDLTDVYLVI
jgi:hypothetical protein